MLTCEHCGKVFERVASNVGRGSHAYCTKACKYAAANNINSDGYRMITVDGKQVREHRYIMEQHLGRLLRSDEDVHHIRPGKEARSDNRIENLQLISKSDHTRLHAPEKFIRRWARKYDRCILCGTAEIKHYAGGKCERCYKNDWQHARASRLRRQ